MPDDIRVGSRFWLYDKTAVIDGQTVRVYGLGRFRVSPKHLGMGTHLIKGMEEMATKFGRYCVLAFCDDSLLDFYIRKCGWCVCGRSGNLNIIASVPVKTVVVTETW